MREFGISTWSWSARFAFRIRLNMSAIGSVNMGFSSISRAKRSGQTSSMENAQHLSSSYQLDFVMPGIEPSCASSRRQILQRPNLRKTARGRPQRRQRV
jgi:hypothetical protein